MTITDFLKLSRSNALLIALCTLLGMAAGFGYTQMQPRLYESTATALVVISDSDSFSADSVMRQKVAAFSRLVEKRSVQEYVAKAVPGPPVSLVGTVDEGTPFVAVTAVAQDPQRAADAANAAVTALDYEVGLLETLLRSHVTSAPDAQTKEPINRTVSSTQILLVDDATVPTKPFKPDVKKNMAVTTFIGFAAAYAIAFLGYALDNRVRQVSDIENLLESAVIGVIPESTELERRGNGTLDNLSETAEALRYLRTNLRFIDVDRPPRMIVITSANPGEGKSTVSRALAQVLAAAGQRTVLIDCDLRRPVVASSFGLESAIGLTQILTGEVDLFDAVQAVDGQPDLRVIAAGRIPPNPSEILGSQRMRALLQRLAEEAIVILDAPPMLPVTDAGLLAAICDGAILVFRAGSTRKEEVIRCGRLLQQVGAHQLGSVLNRVKPSRDTSYYAYVDRDRERKPVASHRGKHRHSFKPHVSESATHVSNLSSHHMSRKDLRES